MAGDIHLDFDDAGIDAVTAALMVLKSMVNCGV